MTDIDKRLDSMNHIADGRILATKEELKQLINEARQEELQAIYVDFDERKLRTTGSTKTELITIEDRLNQLTKGE